MIEWIKNLMNDPIDKETKEWVDREIAKGKPPLAKKPDGSPLTLRDLLEEVKKSC